ncbi:protein-methionine sulfoxide oxidase mical3a-like isoform X2 [Megalops cyprinoides]|uniref:protein-methionine sulfoxide oxidase mical3a-like isoform X2 n=1 Tax=Megalops cyprinoides TaxID=118141 RepID=UPI001864E43A|nr:protein-methionine sulfoxide oxidase mical3a-like isoform X2 [Megalops cyprinoides]
MGDGGVGAGGERANHSHVLFDRFVQATTCKGTLKAFQELCDFLELKPNEYRVFYHKLKSKLNYWKAKALWAKLDKRASHKDYKKGRACANSKCLIIGAGPCGLRTAIELGFLGAKVVLLEKRDAFSRNNVLHLWPFTIQDLRGLGAKKFYGKFCAGAIDHISIRQLQLMLLKVALLLGIEIHVNVEFKGLIEPPEDQENERVGWRAEVHPRTHPVNEFEFDVIIGADGRRNTLPGFRRKEFRGKLAIAITANFINRNTTAEAKVEEISGVAFIFNQKFFQDLREATGIDLENIVYYKDDTHYFVMTAKKQSLLEKGVILHDYTDTELLLSRGNVDQAALLSYAREAADFSTNHQLPTLDFAINHYGQPDVAMFDFTCMYASENAALVRQRNGHQLLVALVGDSLLEPFWPMGTGIARGFLAAMDSAWMVRSWAQGSSPLEVLAERESIYRLLPQTTPENVSKNFSQYSVDPTTRYPNISLHFLRPNQVRHLIDTGESRDLRIDLENVVNSSTPKLTRNENGQLQTLLQESVARSSKLLSWCQRQTEGYRHVSVSDLTMSWKSGLALCALIHRYRPDLIDFDSLEEHDVERNNQLGFDVAEREFGISPIMTGKEMSSVGEPDKLSMVMYLSQFYEMFKDTVPPGENQNLSPEEKSALMASTKSPISFLSKLGQSISRKRNPKDKKEKDVEGVGKRRKTSQSGQSEDEEVPSRGSRDDRPSLTTALTERRPEATVAGNNNKVKSMATQLLAKFEENAPVQSTGLKRQSSLRKEFPQNIGGSDVCFFCRKRVYVMERLSAEGKFFHRSCFKCDYCGTTLRLSSYAFDVEDGKFYCKPHYCYRLSGQAQRKRPAPTPAPLTAKENQAPLPAPVSVDAPGRATPAPAPAEHRPPAAEVNGLQEPSLAKRLRGTPERIELENYRVSLQREEELEEVPEETLAEHNLSSVLDKPADVEEGSSSSESEMEEEDEQQRAASDLGGVPWKEAVQLHAKLKGTSEPGGDANAEEDEEEEEEDEEDDDEEEDEESSDAPARSSARHEAVRAWLESVSGELCEEDDDPEAEAAGPDIEPGTELDEEDIPSDAEAEAGLQRLEEGEALPEDRAEPESQRRVSGLVQSPIAPVQSVGDEVILPVKDVREPEAEASPKSQTPFLLKSPGVRFFPEPFVPDEVKLQKTSLSPDSKSPLSPVLAPTVSPIRSQPVPMPESVLPKSPIQSQPCTCAPTTNPLSPICTQPLPCNEPSTPLSSDSPVRTQPVPAVTSTPLAKPPTEKAPPEPQDPLEPAAETPAKRADIIEEFWMKSAEIRKSLGLSPLERSRGPEKSLTARTPDSSSSPRSYTPEEEVKPAFAGRAVIRRLNITVEGQVICPIDKEPKSSGSDRRDLSSSSGLGLNGSLATSQTAASESYNTSDSTMLTPPSSPPPPPPDEEPASLRQKKPQVGWESVPELPAEPDKIPVTTLMLSPEPKPKPKPAAAPVPAPRTVQVAATVVMRREVSKPRREEARKSFIESVDEIPFADDVEDTYDDRTPESSMQERFFTPPTSKAPRDKPPLHLALAMENGKPSITVTLVSKKPRGISEFSPEAKEVAEERMRAREKSVKSQALKDAMAKHLTKMKELEVSKEGVAKAASNVSPEISGKAKPPQASTSPKTSAVKALESRKQAEALPERFFTAQATRSLEGSGASSESSTGGKSKKRSSLFSPRKNKKEKKAKSEGRVSDKQGPEESPPKHKSLWKTVFSGYKKDKKKKDDKSLSSTPSSATTVDSGKRRASPLGRSSDLLLRRNLSFSEDSDLSCDDVLERSSQKSKADSLYVPHALAFKRAYAVKKAYTEEELNAKLTRRVQRAARRQAKQEELKRLHRAQIIQRQLEQVEEKQRQLEERGVAVEKALRGEADYWGESNYSEILDLHLGGMGKKDDPKLMQEWFKLVQEKNALVRYESELMIFARELELEDRQSRLQQELRERMAVDDHLKTEEELAEEKQILNEMLEVVEQRDSLVALLEVQRLREKEEDKDLEAVMLSKGYNLNWA